MENPIEQGTMASEPALAVYGMSPELRNSDLLQRIRNLSESDKECLIRYICHFVDTDDVYERLDDHLPPYTMEELNARIDEAEQEMDSGGGKTFDEMMAGFKKELLWLK